LPDLGCDDGGDHLENRLDFAGGGEFDGGRPDFAPGDGLGDAPDFAGGDDRDAWLPGLADGDGFDGARGLPGGDGFDDAPGFAGGDAFATAVDFAAGAVAVAADFRGAAELAAAEGAARCGAPSIAVSSSPSAAARALAAADTGAVNGRSSRCAWRWRLVIRSMWPRRKLTVGGIGPSA
jgi:hypothetical protein